MNKSEEYVGFIIYTPLMSVDWRLQILLIRGLKLPAAFFKNRQVPGSNDIHTNKKFLHTFIIYLYSQNIGPCGLNKLKLGFSGRISPGYLLCGLNKIRRKGHRLPIDLRKLYQSPLSNCRLQSITDTNFPGTPLQLSPEPAV